MERMDGYEALWQPGTDHASIATEVKVVEKIRKEEGKSKYELGREEFLKRAMDWKDEYGRVIVDQMKQLGSSCDWDRERFTMDQGCNEAVTEFFVKLYEKGHIYRGNRIINWCPDCKTTLFRGGNGPAIVEVESYRWFGHSTADAGVYRTKEEVDEWKNNNDPIIRYRDYLVSENIASAEELDAIQSQVKAEVDAAYEFAQNSPDPELSVAFEDVWVD